MGLDMGDVRIGIALSDPGRIIAQPWDTLHRKAEPADLAALTALATEHEVDQVVVGWPVMLSGAVGPQARKVDRFADALTAHLALPVERWDERLTTVAAERALREGGLSGRQRRQVVDKVAAALILQSWLDAHPRGTPQ